MKNLMKIVFFIAAIGLYPFGCEAQVNGTIPNPDSCDTVFIEDPARDTVEAELRKLIDDSLSSIASLEKDNGEQAIVISTQSNEIGSLKSSIVGLEAIMVSDGQKMTEMDNDIQILKSEIVVLETELALKPDTIYRDGEIVYVQRDSVTVGGIAYKVSDIEQVLPFQTTDTIDVSWCVGDPTLRKYWHEGDIDVYPHFINFATLEKGMIKVYFKEPLDTIIKKHETLTLQRIRSHKEGITQYDYINSK